ncbi:MAG TPA: ABC transporter permease [Bordetella sp.]|jgi:ABC-type dipeptide/oligopeptide/nickel transport system permease component|nr:ABC transporter permease [Bordetella sp.]
MRGYIVSRLAWGIVIVLCILILNFLIVHLVPGDPLHALLGDFPVPPGYAEKMRADFGLDQPLLTQLWLYLQHLVRGDLGFSFANRMPVLDLILARLGPTLLLMLPALFLSAVLGVALGVTAAPRAGSAQDGALTAISLFGYSVPIFWLGQMLVIVFAIQLGWLPVSGMRDMRGSAQGFGAWLDVAWHLVLPALSVTIYYLAVVARVARASVIEALHHDYVLTAKAKGLSKRYILWHHVLPNAMIPVVTVIGYNFGQSLTGAILVETVFAWPGMGNLFITSIANRDYPVLQGIFLVTAVSVVIVNLLTDLLYAYLDPRVRTLH